MAASTLTEVARLAGVSPATASRVLNGSARKPGKDIADRVRQAADSLGYIPNAQAQGLAKSSSGRSWSRIGFSNPASTGFSGPNRSRMITSFSPAFSQAPGR